MEQNETINNLNMQKNHLGLQFAHIKGAIPSPFVILDKDNNVLDLNKKAEELLGVHIDTVKGKNASSFDIMKKERVAEKMKEFDKSAKPVTVKAISVRNKDGEVSLTDISKIPMHDQKGEIHGSIMVFDDISKTHEAQAELQRKKQEIQHLENRYQDAYTKLKMVNQGKLSMSDHLLNLEKEKEQQIKHVGRILEEKQKQLEDMNKTISSKENMLNDLSSKIEEKQTSLKMVEGELARRQEELTQTKLSDEQLEEIWKDKLKIYDEIDRSLGLTEEDLIKTKKIDHKSETQEE